jgi:RHS repeat-associated protein
MEQVLTTSTAPFSSTTKLSFASGPNSTFSYDDIRVIGSSLADTATSFACNAGNELTSQTQNNVTTNFTYDAWGRMTTKSRGNYTATYAWGQGDKLTAVTSNFPGEGNVTYTYGGDGKRRTSSDTESTNYRFDGRGFAISEEDPTTSSVKTFINLPNLVIPCVLEQRDVTGQGNPVFRDYVHDITGAARGALSEQKTFVSKTENTPYGKPYALEGLTSHFALPGAFRDAIGYDYFRTRYYSPDQARWLSREPSGMDGPNVYWYVLGNPINNVDVNGEFAWVLPLLESGEILAEATTAYAWITSTIAAVSAGLGLSTLYSKARDRWGGDRSRPAGQPQLGKGNPNPRPGEPDPRHTPPHKEGPPPVPPRIPYPGPSCEETMELMRQSGMYDEDTIHLIYALCKMMDSKCPTA